MDCSPPVSVTYAIFQARISEWVAISFPRDGTQVSSIAGRLFTISATIPRHFPTSRLCTLSRVRTFLLTLLYKDKDCCSVQSKDIHSSHHINCGPSPKQHRLLAFHVWVGQKVHLGFPITPKFFGQPNISCPQSLHNPAINNPAIITSIYQTRPLRLRGNWPKDGFVQTSGLKSHLTQPLPLPKETLARW